MVKKHVQQTQPRKTQTKKGRPGARPSAVRAKGRLSLEGVGPTDLSGVSSGILGSLLNGRAALDVDLLISDAVQTLTVLENSTPAFTIVHRGPAGAGFWDHQLKAFAEFSPKEMAGTKISPASKVQISKQEDGELVRVEIQMEDPILGSLRHELTFSRKKELAPFGAALFRVLHCGPKCHQASGLPYEELSSLGFVIAERTFLKDSNQPFTELHIDVAEITRVDPGDFQAPRGYQSLLKVTKPQKHKGDAPVDDGSSKLVADTIRQALDDTNSEAMVTRAFKIRDDLTPDCLGSTRFGAITATIHQDLFDHVSSVTNTIAPLLGATTITGGTWTVPWLAALSAINAANGAAPGSGIFSFLRNPRVPSTAPGGPSGGLGLLDRVAWRDLTQVDGGGMTRTQREFRDGTLAATLTTWGIPVPGLVAAQLNNTSGDLRTVPLDSQIALVEGYETAELGVFRLTGMPNNLGPFSFGSIQIAGQNTPPLMRVGITGVTGTVNFGALGGGPLITTATIGASGNVVLGLTLPAITLGATVTRSLTGFGGFVLGAGTVGLCLAIPFICPMAVVLVTVTAFVMNNVTSVAAVCTGVTLALNVQWSFDSNTQRVDPFVTVLGSTGTVTITTTWVTPNIIANTFDSLVTGIGNLFNAWLTPFAQQAAQGIQQALRDSGLQLPVAGRQTGLTAVGGGASSNRSSLLELRADVQPISNVAAQPFITQTSASSQIDTELTHLHLDLRRGLNPQPVPAPALPIIPVGDYIGLGLSQNVLNYYLFSQWVQKRFEVTTGDPQIIQRILQLAPPKLFARFPRQVHMWPASPPRIETMPTGIAGGVRPLLVFFDDVRACFEIPNRGSGGDGPVVFGGWELSFNVKTTGTITFGWPLVFDVVVDNKPASFAPCDERSWEFVDTNVPNIMGQVRPADLAGIVELLSGLFLANVAVSGAGTPPAPRPWNRRLIAMQQEILPSVPANAFLTPQMFYLEILHLRKVIYVLPALDTVLMQLVDGSGAPLLNTLLGLLGVLPPGTTVSARTMNRAQGIALRDFVLPLLGLPTGPP